eukprot:scaffold187950_cov44-Attheya_sp.AAC.2
MPKGTRLIAARLTTPFSTSPRTIALSSTDVSTLPFLSASPLSRYQRRPIGRQLRLRTKTSDRNKIRGTHLTNSAAQAVQNYMRTGSSRKVKVSGKSSSAKKNRIGD